ncbi:hypothetical protein GQ53DRAFT_451005 [Thozetella sp. PMI_491]|nr:hypothetical protein GQ53DRAFT_451005 [Thozetella sp. PMI_491]
MNSLKKMLHPNRRGNTYNEPVANTHTAAPMQTTHENPAAIGTTTHAHHHDQQHHHHTGRDAALAGGVAAGAYGAHRHHAKHRRDGSNATSEGTSSMRSSAEFGGPRGMDMANAGALNAAAEAGNNFPGTNPHPAFSALGGGRGSIFPGRE